MSTKAPSVAAAVASEKKPSLKRSASTASLPTPPRTQRRSRTLRKRTIFLGTDSDIAEEDSGAEGGHDQSKKRKLGVASENDIDDEDAFWSGTPVDFDRKPSLRSVTPEPKAVKTPTTVKTPLDAPDSPVPMLTRRRKAEASGSVLLSPPPSYRKPAVKRKTKKKVAAKDVLPVITEDVFAKEEESKGPEFTFRPPAEDAINNPFLDSPTPQEEDSAPATPAKAKKPSSRVRDELPMLTMVTRGQRRRVPNPYYDPVTQTGKSPKPESLLPIDHPDYEPDFRCPPKVLFPQAHRKAKTVETSSKKSKGKAVAKSEWDSSDDEGPSRSKANPLLMAPLPR